MTLSQGPTTISDEVGPDSMIVVSLPALVGVSDYTM